MVIRQVVQVSILGAPRTYTYEYFFDLANGERSLGVGDKVELPPNQVQEEGSSGTVVDLGSNYDGPMKQIVRRIEAKPEPSWEVYSKGPDEVGVRPVADDGLWEGFGEGDYA